LAQIYNVELSTMTDAAAAEPLISGSREDPQDAQYDESDAPYDGSDARDADVDESALVSPGLFIWGLTICAGVSGLLFGYEYVGMSHLVRHA
jgi:SP family myo-inositol transporter-like MFS transporter 13